MAGEGKAGEVRYAVVGTGWISQAAFMPEVAQTGNSRMVAIVTGDVEKGRAVARLYGIEHVYAYGELDRMIAEGVADAAYVATPNHRHLEHAVPLLRAGIHVLLEKPAASRVEDAEAIARAAAEGAARLMVAYRLHFEPGTLDALRRVREGEIGVPTVFTSTFTQFVAADNHRAREGFWAGPVADMGPYPINACRMLFDSEPVGVRAVGTRGQGWGFDDTVAVVLRFPGDRLASFTVAYGPASVSEYRIVGTKGDLRAQPAYGFGPGVSIATTTTIEGKKRSHGFKATAQFAAETRYFSACVLEGRDPEPDGEEGVCDMRVIAAIERALGSGAEEALPPMRRRRQVSVDQGESLPQVTVPELVGAAAPGG